MNILQLIEEIITHYPKTSAAIGIFAMTGLTTYILSLLQHRRIKKNDELINLTLFVNGLINILGSYVTIKKDLKYKEEEISLKNKVETGEIRCIKKFNMDLFIKFLYSNYTQDNDLISYIVKNINNEDNINNYIKENNLKITIEQIQSCYLNAFSNELPFQFKYLFTYFICTKVSKNLDINSIKFLITYNPNLFSIIQNLKYQMEQIETLIDEINKFIEKSQKDNVVTKFNLNDSNAKIIMDYTTFLVTDVNNAIALAYVLQKALIEVGKKLFKNDFVIGRIKFNNLNEAFIESKLDESILNVLEELHSYKKLGLFVSILKKLKLY